MQNGRLRAMFHFDPRCIFTLSHAIATLAPVHRVLSLQPSLLPAIISAFESSPPPWTTKKLLQMAISDQSAEDPHHKNVEATKHIFEADTLFFQDEHPTIPPPPYIKLPFSRPRRPLPPSQLPTHSERLTQTHFSHKEFKLNPREYLEQGEYIGEIFTPKDIRNILTASGYFV